MKRYALLAPLDGKSQKQVDKIKKDLQKLHNIEVIKTPTDIEKRQKMDTLPSHVTICSWDKFDKALLLNLDMRLKKYKPQNLDFGTFDSFVKDGFVLFFKPEQNAELAKMHQDIFTITETDYYPPGKWQPHATLLITDSEDKLKDIKKILKPIFTPFPAKLEYLLLVEYYPVKIIKKFKL